MKNTMRSKRGVSGLIIVLATAFMILLPLGFLGYEYMRYTLVQQQLRAVTDSAALAGAVGIATNGGSESNDLWQQDSNAMAAAYDAFCQNSLSDCPLYPIGQSGANVNSAEAASTTQPGHFNNSTPWTNVAANTAQVNFVLLDANGNQTNWSAAAGSSQPDVTSATSLRVDAYYGYTLPILGALNIGPFTMTASSTGGLPQLDVILCFDISGSMDDFTNVTLVNRYWTYWTGNQATSTMSAADVTALGQNPNTWTGGCIEYDIPPSSGAYSPNPPYWTSSSVGYAQGPLYYITGCNTQSTSYNGTSVNVQPPMNLNQEALCPIKFMFMSGQCNSGAGNPPGNYNATTPTPPSAPNANNGLPAYTDLVVNLNGNSNWLYSNAPIATGGQTFNTLAWAVEAARGNLESASALQSAINPQAATTPASSNGFGYILSDSSGRRVVAGTSSNSFASIASSGQLGSQLAYWNFVQNNTHPLNDAVSAAQNNFFQFLHDSADCHFGLICFSDGIGSNPTDTWADGSESPPGTTSINGWTTASVNGVSQTPPLSASIAGHYTGGTAMGPPDSNNPTGVDPDGIDSAGGNCIVPLPLIQLNNGVAYSTSASYDNFTTGTVESQFMTVYNSTAWGAGQISVDTNNNPSNPRGIVATGSTDITDALAEAVRELTPANGLTRPNATRAIVLFTDGVPNIDANNMPPSSNFTGCVGDCAAQGTSAFSASPSITIFSIGLALDTSMQGDQSQLLNAINVAANGGTTTGQSSWQQITNASQIQSAFQAISKNLVVITK